MTDINAEPKLRLIDLVLRYPDSNNLRKTEEDGLLAVNLVGDDSERANQILIQPGEFTILLGPSGCGKSSLLRLIAGLERPTYGKVLKDNVEIEGTGPDRGMVFQSYTSFPWLTVEENILFSLNIKNYSGGTRNKKEVNQENREKVHRLLELIGLLDAINKYPKELSGGMKQRVAIARALVNDPDILLMDEPFGALDPHIRVKMQDLMLKIERELQTTIVFVTHDAREAIILGDIIFISTLCPCFFKYRIEHPFVKEKIPREEARKKYARDFNNFQLEVEERMQYLIENPDISRVIEEGDWTIFKRSTLGILEELSDDINTK